MPSTDVDLEAELRRITAELPGGGEDRAGQLAMAEAVAESIQTGRHLVVQAGTGTGKTLAYLLPAVLLRVSVVVATATTCETRRSTYSRTHGPDRHHRHHQRRDLRPHQ